MYYYEEIDWLPEIPNDLIDDLNTINSRGNIFPIKDVEHIYASYLVSPDLKKFLQSYFDYPINARYQVIRQQLPVHVDVGDLPYKFNYLIDTGGEVKTRWWSQIEDPKNLEYGKYLKPNTWYKLNVAIPHDISSISRPRISVEVHKPKNTEETDEMPDR